MIITYKYFQRNSINEEGELVTDCEYIKTRNNNMKLLATSFNSESESQLM